MDDEQQSAGTRRIATEKPRYWPRWLDPGRPLGAVLAAMAGCLIVYGLIEFSHHITIAWR